MAGYLRPSGPKPLLDKSVSFWKGNSTAESCGRCRDCKVRVARPSGIVIGVPGDGLDRIGRPSLPTTISREWPVVENRWRPGNGFLVFYCCAIPLTTTAKGGFSPVESSMLAEKVQWSWSSLDTVALVPPSA